MSHVLRLTLLCDASSSCQVACLTFELLPPALQVTLNVALLPRSLSACQCTTLPQRLLIYRHVYSDQVTCQTDCSCICLQVSCLQCKAAVGLDLHVQHDCALTAEAARRKLEEVLTQAGMLTCPKCDTSIVKESGCNHMTCGKCRTHLCLLCCAVISQQNPYQHFHAAGSQCWVFDDVSRGQTEAAAMQRRQIVAANKYIASLEPAMALQVVQNNSLLRDFPDGSIMLPAQ